MVVHYPASELPEVYPGMSLAEARGRAPGLMHFPCAPEEDAKALEAIARWLMKFSPGVALAPPSSIFVDATGVERLFGGIHLFHNKIAQSIRSLRLHAGVAIAPTPAAAWALAAFVSSKSHIILDDPASALGPLPPAALRLEPRTLELLASLGITRIDQILRLDRKELAVRFGSQILLRIDQALGAAPEPLVFLPHHVPLQATIEFDGAVQSLEVIHLAVRQLIEQIVQRLTTRALGARELLLRFECPYAPWIEKRIRLSRPSRNSAALFNLLQCALETMPLDDGVLAVHLHAPITQRLEQEQPALIGGEQQQADVELDHLIERLRTRLGDRQHGSEIEWAELIESHIPERAFRYHAEQSASATTVLDSPHARIGEFRPLCLLPRPRPISVIVTPSESADGQPISFTDRGTVHRLHHVRGPERMTGEWWTTQFKTRDYFDALDITGNRFWLFRVLETRLWYLHGIFE
jgi:protein ImuB